MFRFNCTLDQLWADLNLSQIVLPSICLALPFLAYVARLTRNSLLDVMSQNFMRTAKAKGLDDATALARHALKVAMEARERRKHLFARRRERGGVAVPWR